MAQKRRKPGRPRSPVNERRRNILTIRLTDEDRARVERMAKRHGCSMSEEIEGQLADQRLAEVLSDGAFNLTDLVRLREYAQAVRRLLATRVGGDKDRWLSYARHLPFPLSQNADEHERDLKLAARGMRRQLYEEKEFWSDNPLQIRHASEEELARNLFDEPSEEEPK